MKTNTKTLLIALATIALTFLTSCENEMDKGLTGGGGKEVEMNSVYMPEDPLPVINNGDTIVQSATTPSTQMME